MKPGEKILAYAYDDFAFHLYQAGHMKRHLKGETSPFVR